jgi:hypothetical protein
MGKAATIRRKAMKKTYKDNTNAKLTAKQAKKYVKAGGCKCPHCGASDVEGGSFEPEEG